MSLVNAKCPNCGASIQLDDSREEGFCLYCGSKVKVQEATSKIRIDKSGEVHNYLELAKYSIDTGNGADALDYANKALEADSSNTNAWFLKMESSQQLITLGNMRCQEIIIAGNKILSLDNSQEMKKKVYSFFLTSCSQDLLFCKRQLRDTESIKETYKYNIQNHSYKGIEETRNDDTDLNMAIEQEPKILNLRFSVPDAEISADAELATLTSDIAIQFVNYEIAINARLNVYGYSMDDNTLKKYKYNLHRIQQGLPPEKQKEIGADSMSNAISGPCYIATAVYGSYDCPEVWTLRRYRDYSLSKSIPGRAFIRIYYAISPSFVRWFGDTAWFRLLLKPILDKFVSKLEDKGYESTPYQDKEW